LIGILRKEGVSTSVANPILERIESSPISQQVKLSTLITRPHVDMSHMVEMSEVVWEKVIELNSKHEDCVEQAEILLKYEGYIVREEEQVSKLERMEEAKIPSSLNYAEIKSLSIEAKEKLSKLKPVTIGQASRVSGVSPSDISVLLIHLGR
jgi:tRNA uridine 5-carboxymethylaminomethyl modification enzyme